MLIKLPIVFSEAARADTKPVQSYGDVVDVLIREPSDYEAPVATRWQNNERFSLPGGVMETRWFEGRHYRPVLAEYPDVAEVVHVAREDLGRELIGGFDRNGLFIKNYTKARDFLEGQIPNLKPKEMTEALRAAREKAHMAARQSAHDVIIVGGKVWIACGEPVYEVRQVSEIGHYVRPIIPEIRPGVRPTNYIDFYRADRYEDAVEEAELRGSLPGIPASSRRIEVIVPESLVFDDERHALVETAALAAKSVGLKRRSDVSQDFILAYSALYNSIKTARTKWDEDSASEFEAAYDAFVKFFPEDSDIARNHAMASARWSSARPQYTTGYAAGRPVA